MPFLWEFLGDKFTHTCFDFWKGKKRQNSKIASLCKYLQFCQTFLSGPQIPPIPFKFHTIFWLQLDSSNKKLKVLLFKSFPSNQPTPHVVFVSQTIRSESEAAFDGESFFPEAKVQSGAAEQCLSRECVLCSLFSQINLCFVSWEVRIPRVVFYSRNHLLKPRICAVLKKYHLLKMLFLILMWLTQWRRLCGSWFPFRNKARYKLNSKKLSDVCVSASASSSWFRNLIYSSFFFQNSLVDRTISCRWDYHWWCLMLHRWNYQCILVHFSLTKNSGFAGSEKIHAELKKSRWVQEDEIWTVGR